MHIIVSYGEEKYTSPACYTYDTFCISLKLWRIQGGFGGSVEPPFAQKYLSGNLRTPTRIPLHRILDLPQLKV